MTRQERYDSIDDNNWINYIISYRRKNPCSPVERNNPIAPHETSLHFIGSKFTPELLNIANEITENNLEVKAALTAMITMTTTPRISSEPMDNI